MIRCWACIHVRAAVAVVILKKTGARVPVCARHRAEANERHEDIVIAPLATAEERLGFAL